VVLIPPSLVLLVLPLDPVPLLEVPVHHLELEDAPFWRKIPGPTSKLSPRVPAQMGQRETEHEGGKKEGVDRKGETRGLRVVLRPGRVRL
jgi:hypothetical protein